MKINNQEKILKSPNNTDSDQMFSSEINNNLRDWTLMILIIL